MLYERAFGVFDLTQLQETVGVMIIL